VWDGERPWRATTHVVWEGALPVVDLHDLKARNARLVLRRLVAEADALEAGAVLVVCGRGRHSVGPPVLHRLTGDVLAAAARDRDGWRVDPRGSAAWLLVTRPDAAPAVARGASTWFLAAFFLLVVGAVAWLLLGR
jgi:hypothetical protein